MNNQNNNGYLLLFRGDESYAQLPREELQELIEQNKGWFERLMSAGKIKTGQPLERQGATVSGKNGRHVVDGPYAESKEVIGGYLLLDVETFDEALEIAKSSPGLALGGVIEVRPIAEECPLEARARELANEPELATV